MDREKREVFMLLRGDDECAIFWIKGLYFCREIWIRKVVYSNVENHTSETLWKCFNNSHL